MTADNNMDSQMIDALKFRAYLKPPQDGVARVELCNDSFGRLFAVKWIPEDQTGSGRKRQIPGSLVYDCLTNEDNHSHLQHLPQLLGSDVIKAGKGSISRIVTEYCHGDDLEGLVGHALLEGEGLPESFLWHIIKGFIEYCFALSTSYLNLHKFDPAHVLFIFDTPNYINRVEDPELQYPRVVFCGTRGIEQRTSELDRNELASHEGSCISSIKGLGRYLLNYIKSVTYDNNQPTTYSVALISWLEMLAGADGKAPPRFFDLFHLLQMLYGRINEYRGPAKSLKLTPWLYRYFSQGRNGLDKLWTVMEGLKRQETGDDIDRFIEEGYPPCGELDILPPKMSSDEKKDTFIGKLSVYFDDITNADVADRQRYVRRWPREESSLVLGEMQGLLSNFMQGSLERAITLATFSLIWMAPTNNLSFTEIPMTKSIYDAAEPEIFQRLLRSLARCHQIITEQNRQTLTDLAKKNESTISTGSMDGIQRLLNEVETRYQAALTKAAWDADRWKWLHREVRSTLKVGTSCLEWERWFAIQGQGFALACEFARDPTHTKAEKAEQFLRVELDIPLKRRLKQITQDKIVTRGGVANEWFERKNAGLMYDVPDWKEDSEDFKIRQARHKAFNQDNWTNYLNELRENGTKATHLDIGSPKNTSKASPPSPKAKITGKISHARDLEAEYAKITNRPRLPPRRRKDISPAEMRVFKIYKRWRRKYAREDVWYTEAALYENFRQQFRRRSRTLEEIRTSFNRRGNMDPHSQLDPVLIQSYEDALEHVDWYLSNHEPTKPMDEMSLCSSASDASLPVEERKETWDVSESSGEEDEQRRWVSKRKRQT